MAKKFRLAENYINRELSWINFNERVLEKAIDKKTPLLDQAKFSAIFSNNLDEFFMVRVASLKSQVEAGVTKKSEDNKTPTEQLIQIREKLLPSLQKQQTHYLSNLKDAFRKENIFLLDYIELTSREKNWVDNYFKTAIFPILTPLAVDPAHPFPFVSNLSLNIAALIRDPDSGQQQFSRVKVPQKTIARFITIPSDLSDKNPKPIYSAIPVEQVVAFNLNLLFPGMEIEEHSFFRVTRDADLELRDLEADDLMIALEQGLRKRRMGGEIVRLEVLKTMPKKILDLLMESMDVEEADLYCVDGLLGLDELFELITIDTQHLSSTSKYGKIHNSLKNSQYGLLEDGSIKQEEFRSIFSIIRAKDLLLHHPYDLFTSSVEEFINQSADDPLVMGIKMTLYRVSKDSPIIEALIRAAENGKQVMALVELKARFDEDNNIQWAKQLEKSGVHVVYGVVGLKTHTKIALVIRKEKERLRSYFHIGTGNYNSKTSNQYTDLGLLSVQPELGQDLVELFNYLTGFSKQPSFRKLLVAPVSLRRGIETLIQREIENAKNGKQAKIKAKMNALVDPSIINLLYEASQAGVKIELIVRGMCCLYPKKEGLSEKIRVVSIIGKYLEHSRIFWFYNNNQPEVFIGSADWMRRNLDRRVEAVTPIEDPTLKKQLNSILEIYLNDNVDAWEMQSNGKFLRKSAIKSEEISAQNKLMDF
ncbi:MULTISPECIES: polyphosphate kinase 1 [Prochlorococcus]|uniref:Polyphosphate kinase n=1 Tax=Prochlorococcus marinus (strain SARG / CCMP1375 / SS120) TaxID=167539 RepID=Q7V9H1_PROMA|nr:MULTISPECIES: polyphosphate kinase 1 [Prochlorococcus]AAQ00906.1 Polyphosphate kinase [Prochlorococcus marinus subsp. marinus str. CCMP1375]KGG10599.1 Polyphosphate kinase [Prochlorococcus marinus str. LG]KGG19935.1 Polyphosphate kinase [Prochlorococcus marinus str. SS2]KGG31895.1 Polyphosphate kinase [Prochlorococcus marinus str. SS51]KGG35940.1 Polyphosphate kinase [Prochlorococcus sp. SS52]